MKRLHHLFGWFVLCLSLISTSALAETVVIREYWIGRPTVGDYIAYSVRKGLNQAVAYRQALGAAQAELEQARAAFFKASPEDRTAAGDRLGELLFAKDYLLGQFLLVGGYSNHTHGVNWLMSAIGGGPFDGGIRPSASRAYDRWIRAMRSAMGAKSENDMIALSPTNFVSALEKTRDVFDAYRQARDLAEHRAWRGRHPLPEDEPGRRALRGPGEPATLRVALANRGLPLGMKEEVTATDRAGPTLLRCRYGSGFDKDGDEAFGEFFFWKDSLPANIERLLAYDRTGMDRVRDHVVSSCPSTEMAALALTQKPVTTVVPQALTDEVQARLRQHQEEQAAAQARGKAALAAKNAELKARQAERDAAAAQRRDAKAAERQAEQARVGAEMRAKAAERREAMMAGRDERLAANRARNSAENEQRDAVRIARRQCRDEARALAGIDRETERRCLQQVQEMNGPSARR